MNVSAVVEEVLRRLDGQYRVVGSLVAGSAVTDPENALDVDMCVVVHDNVLRQAKLFVLDMHVDLFVCGIGRRREIVGVPGTDGQVYQYTQLDSALNDFQTAYANARAAGQAVALAWKSAASPGSLPPSDNYTSTSYQSTAEYYA